MAVRRIYLLQDTVTVGFSTHGYVPYEAGEVLSVCRARSVSQDRPQSTELGG
jgi:hypothetical protein